MIHGFRKNVLILCLGLWAAACARYDNPAADARPAIRAVLDAQVAAWNAGDLEGYLDGYERSPQLLFASRGAFSRGWEPLLAKYRRAYPEGKMGRLEFGDVEIHPLGSNAAWVSGTWKLDMSGSSPHGVFTLVFRKTRHGWKIVHDHSSGAPDSTDNH